MCYGAEGHMEKSGIVDGDRSARLLWKEVSSLSAKSLLKGVKEHMAQGASN